MASRVRGRSNTCGVLCLPGRGCAGSLCAHLCGVGPPGSLVLSRALQAHPLSRRTAALLSGNASTLVPQGCCPCRSPAWNTLLPQRAGLSLPSLHRREAAPDQQKLHSNPSPCPSPISFSPSSTRADTLLCIGSFTAWFHQAVSSMKADNCLVHCQIPRDLE